MNIRQQLRSAVAAVMENVTETEDGTIYILEENTWYKDKIDHLSTQNLIQFLYHVYYYYNSIKGHLIKNIS